MVDKKSKDVELTEHKGMLTVTKSIPGEDEEVSDEHIEVRPFKSEVARVRVSKGLTINMGNYESARIDVDLMLPCYPEEVKEMMKYVDTLVEAKLIEERNSAVKARSSK